MDSAITRRAAAAAAAVLVPAGAPLWAATRDDPGDPAAASPEEAAGVCSSTMGPEHLADANSYQDALAEYLQSHGIAREVWTVVDRRFVVWDVTDPAANVAAEAFERASAPGDAALLIRVDPLADCG